VAGVIVFLWLLAISPKFYIWLTTTGINSRMQAPYHQGPSENTGQSEYTADTVCQGDCCSADAPQDDCAAGWTGSDPFDHLLQHSIFMRESPGA